MTKKEQVIEAARQLFGEYGYRKVSMDEIAEKSGVTKKTIYTYFKDKNDLAKHFLYEGINDIKKITEEIDKKDIPFATKINEMLIAILKYRKGSKILNIFMKETRPSSINANFVAECRQMLNDTILTEIKIKLEEAIEKGYIKPCNPEITSFIIYKVYIALMFEWEKPFNEEEATNHIMTFLKEGLLK